MSLSIKTAITWCTAFLILNISAIATMQAMDDYGFAVAAMSAFITLSASLMGFGLAVRWIEQKFNMQMVERWEDLGSRRRSNDR